MVAVNVIHRDGHSFSRVLATNGTCSVNTPTSDVSLQNLRTKDGRANQAQDIFFSSTNSTCAPPHVHHNTAHRTCVLGRPQLQSHRANEQRAAHGTAVGSAALFDPSANTKYQIYV